MPAPQDTHEDADGCTRLPLAGIFQDSLSHERPEACSQTLWQSVQAPRHACHYIPHIWVAIPSPPPLLVPRVSDPILQDRMDLLRMMVPL